MPAFYARNALHTNGKRSAKRTTPRAGSDAHKAGIAWVNAQASNGHLVCWFDAADVSVADGAVVDSWVSRVNGISLAPPADSNRPVLDADGWNGGPVVKFTGTAGMRVYFGSGIASEAISAAALAYTNDTTNTATICEYTGNVYNNRGFALLTEAGKPRTELGADSARSYAVGPSACSANTPFAIGVIADRDDSPDTITVWDESGKLSPGSTGATDGSGDHETAWLYVGSRLATGSRTLNGAIRSLVVFKDEMPEAAFANMMKGMGLAAGGFPATGAPAEEGGGGAGETLIDFSTLSEPWGTALASRTEGGTFCQPNGPGGYYAHDFGERISFEAPSGKRIRFTITMAKLDDDWQKGFSFIEPVGAGSDSKIVPTIYGDSSTNSGTFASASVPLVVETSVGQNTGDFWFSSNHFAQNVRNDGEWRVTVEFF